MPTTVFRLAGQRSMGPSGVAEPSERSNWAIVLVSRHHRFVDEFTGSITVRCMGHSNQAAPPEPAVGDDSSENLEWRPWHPAWTW